MNPQPGTRNSKPVQLTADYAEALRYLAGQPDSERDGLSSASLGLTGIAGLLEALGHPERRYPSVLIAGTKGKGSTAAMVERTLRASGYHTGLSTQPHLHTIRERIRVDGVAVSQDHFVQGMDAVRSAAAGPPPAVLTAYEMVTALALHHFAGEQVDVAVLEVGLGGRLDATNIVDATVSVLTSISLDHTQVLGDTLEAIAWEKADIIKRGHPCVSAPQPDEAMAVIRRVSQERSARLYVGGSEGARWRQRADGGWDLDTDMGCLQDVRLALRGGFQRINAAVAVLALEALASQGVAAIDLDCLRTGLEGVQWPGRFEVVPGEPTVILDGAHNVESARRLREALAEERPGRTPVLVLGIAADKDIGGIVEALCSAGESPAPGLVVTTRAAHPRAAAVEAIAGAVRDRGVPATVAPRVSEALAMALQRAEPIDDVVVTGSLHVVAEAREALGLAQPSGERALDPWAIP